MKPTVCKECGCSGPACKYYKSTDKWPYFICTKNEGSDDENEEEEEE
jgi:hypothetical protein